MTENEAKSCIQGKLDCMNRCDVFDCKNTDECDNCEFCYSQGNFGEQKKAFEMAIQALEEIQRQKTKIGMFVTLGERMEISSRFAKLEQYEAIGTIDEFKALKENSFFNFDSPVVRIDEKSYNKAIDEFVNALINYQPQDEDYKSFSDVCYEVAEKLKGGAEWQI